jgi:hypothetical protein
MTDSHNEIARLSSRVSALEKSNRRWQLGALLLFVLMVAAVFLTGPKSIAWPGTKGPISKAVVAQEFLLTDSHGNVRGRMTMDHGQPILQFFNKAGQVWWFAPPKTGFLPVVKPR